MTLTTISEDIPPGAKNWYQKIADRWAAVNSNFALLLTKINAVATAAVKTVNGSSPDANGNVAIVVPTGADVQVFTASGTWVKPTGAKQVTMYVRNAGQGGPGGGRPQAGNSVWGVIPQANGGSFGLAAVRVMSAADLPSSVPVTVAAGTVGGVGITPTQASTNESAGLAGALAAQPGTTSFGVFCVTAPGTIVGDNASSGVTPGSGAPSVFATTAGTQFAPAARSTPSVGLSPTGGTAVGGSGGTNGADNSALAVNGGDGTDGGSGGVGTGTGGLGAGGGAGGAGGWQTDNTGNSTARGGNGGKGGNGGFPGGGGGAGGPLGRPSFTGQAVSRYGQGGQGGTGAAGVVIAVTTF